MLADLRELRDSFRVQLRVIRALLLREMITRYGRHNIGFLWLFIEPMTFTLGVTALWSVLRSSHGSNIPIVTFAITGYSTVLLWRNMPGRCIGAVGPNLSLMYHRNVKVFDIFVSRLVLELGGATVSFMVLSAIFIAGDWMKPPEDVLLVVFGWIMLAWFGMALASFLGALAERSELVEKVWHPISYLMFPLSGVGFLLDALPVQGREILMLVPIVHGVEIIRDGFFGSLFRAHYDIGYMAMFNLVLTALALAEIRTVAQRVTP